MERQRTVRTDGTVTVTGTGGFSYTHRQIEVNVYVSVHTCKHVCINT